MAGFLLNSGLGDSRYGSTITPTPLIRTAHQGVYFYLKFYHKWAMPPPRAPKSAAPVAPYTKPALSTAALVAHLQTRGLVIADVGKATETLEWLGYYRLLIYCRPLQDGTKNFKPGTTFEQLVELYEFDRKLRLLCLDAIERLEVGLRAAISSTIATALGSHFYMDRGNFQNFEGWRDFQNCVLGPNKYLGVVHYYSNYSTPSMPPIWTVVESITFGKLSKFYAALVPSAKKLIKPRFRGYDEELLESWFKSLNYLRNICAHHNRLWNAGMLVDRPKQSKHLPALVNTDRLYGRLVLCVELLKGPVPGNGWRHRLISLLDEYPTIDDRAMGFPVGWRKDPFWT